MAYRPKKTTKKVENDAIVEKVEETPTILQYQIVEEPVNPAATFEKEDIIEIKEEVIVEVEKEVILEPVVALADQNQEMINKLKEKLMNGTITDGEAAEYRMLVN